MIYTCLIVPRIRANFEIINFCKSVKRMPAGNIMFQDFDLDWFKTYLEVSWERIILYMRKEYGVNLKCNIFSMSNTIRIFGSHN